MKLSFTHYTLKSVCFLLFFFLLGNNYLIGATIGDWVWADANNNGLLEGGEGGIGETIIQLFDNTGNLIATTESNHDGYYLFKDLSAGTYTVSVVESTLVAPLTTPNSYTVTLSENEKFLTADFGQLTTFSTNNKPPVIITKNACTAPQTPVTVCLEIFEPEGDNTTITEGSTQTGATFTILNEDCFRYTPLPGYEGVDTVAVTVCDDANPSGCAIGKIAVSVPCPGGPLAVEDNVTTTQSTPIIIEVLANDNGQPPLLVTNVEDSPNGTTLLINNVVLYTPDAGFIGVDSFTYSITDASNQTSSATVYITVTGMSIDCELEMMQCIEVDIPMVICPEYCEVEGSSLNVIEITSAVGGQLIGSPTEVGCYKYIPPAGFIGTDIATILACNEEGNCAQTTINIEVATSCGDVGDDIVAEDDFAVAIQNTFILLNVLGNDFDPQGDDFSLQSFGQAANGTVTQEGDLLQYVPNTNFTGIDSFTYTICDVNGNCDDAMVTIEVIGDGIQDCTEVAEVCDNATTPTEICVEFCNVSDAMITGLSSVFESTLSINSAVCFGYTPPSGFAGIDEVEVIGCNELGVCDTLTVTVEVKCPAPTANDDVGATMVGQLLSLNVLENDAQTCDYTLSATLIGGAQMGEAAITSNGDLSYTPNEGATGQEILTYIACNNCSESLCDTAIVTITVGELVNQAPIAVDDEGITLPNTLLQIFVLANDSDPDGDNISVTATTSPSNGTVTINPDTQAVTYTPNTDFTGTDSFTYQICDDGEPVLCSTATVTITVGDVGVNNPPIAVDDAIVTQINQLIGIGVLGNDSDPDGDDLTIAAISNPPANGTAVIVGFNNSAINYTPNPNFIGTDTLEYVVCDTGGLCDTAQVIITVINPGGNAPPIAVNDNETTDVNTPISIDVLANDVDANGDNLSINTINSAPSNGTATIDNGLITYTPNTDFVGTDNFEYVVCDPDGLCDTALVTVTVIGEGGNQPPTAIDDNATVAANTPLTIDVLANDSDPDGDNLTISTISSNPSNGTVTIDNGLVIYTPNTDFIGTDNFEYVVCDLEGLCDTALVTVTVVEAGDNQPPVAIDDAIVTQINLLIGIGVLANDSDPDGDDLTITTISSPPSNGIAEIVGFNNSSINYTPNNNFVGTDTFEYVVCDPLGFCDTAQVVVTVINPGGNQPPIAIDDNATTGTNTLVSINVLANDVDPEGDDLTITSINTAPSNGTATINNGVIDYLPNTDFIGTDSFEYTICDSEGLCDVGLVVIIVSEEGNQAPIAVDDNVITQINELIGIGVLANDSDPDGDNLTVTNISNNPTNGTVEIIGNSSVNYTPNEGFVGIDSFEYVICDPVGLCDTATVTITVVDPNVNQAPIAVDDEATTEVNTPISIEVLANDSDPDGDTLTITDINELPSNGTVTIEGSAVNYTPNTDFIGTDSFEYVICDTEGLCDTALVVVNVVEEIENQAPIAVDDEATTEVNTPISIEVLANDSDPDGDDLTITDINELPSNGTVTIEGSAVNYTPNTDFIGTDSFEYVICDTEGLCDTALVVVNVVEEIENQPPIAVDDEATTTPNTPIDIPILDNDSDPDGDELAIITFSLQPSNGFASINEDGTGIVYTPNEDFEGMDTLEYVICDPDGLCDTALVVITIAEPPFPIIADTTDEDTPLTLCVEEFLDTINFPIDSMTIFVLPSNGTVLINDASILSDSCFVYTPTQDFNGNDDFLLGICNVAEGICDTITVNITVLPVNDPPIANDDLANTDVNTPIEIPVLDNDSDIDGDSLAVVTIETAPSNGEAIINADGTVTYTPDTDFVGIDTFEYVIADPDGLTDTALVIIGVGEELGIVAVDDATTTEMDTPIDIPVLDNDLFGDFPTDSIIITIASNPSNGIVGVNGDGIKDTTITYTPLPDFVGTDTFEYVVCIAELCDTAMVVVTVIEGDTSCEIFIPNAFSPNQDGVNDELMIPNLGACFPENELVIFNRWGDEIFRRQNYNDSDDPWDGTWQKNKEDVPDGTYFYILTGQDEEGVALEPRSGFIEICR